eukprot:gb/GECG01002567.1/.p1 GENE.gb/GECG01002567.1/~~gb/GECG01002567.1/.p1  ORF type:complete len:707 (+),score=68.25 gb/GECG01002567.1/:1-2121(+)
MAFSGARGWHGEEDASRQRSQTRPCEVCGSTDFSESDVTGGLVCDMCGTQTEQGFQEVADGEDIEAFMTHRRMDTQATQKQKRLLKELSRAGTLSQDSVGGDMASAASFALSGSQMSASQQSQQRGHYLDIGDSLSLSQSQSTDALPGLSQLEFSQQTTRQEASQQHSKQGSASSQESLLSPVPPTKQATLEEEFSCLEDKQMTKIFLRSFQQVLQAQAIALGKLIDIPKKEYMTTLKQLWTRYLLKWRETSAPVVMIINGEIYSSRTKLYNTYLDSDTPAPRIVPVSKQLSLAFQLVVCRWLRLPIVAEDLVQWAITGCVPFINPVPVISTKLSASKAFSPAFKFWMTRNEGYLSRILKSSQIFSLCATLARNIGVPLPAPNTPLIACRLCVKMGLEAHVDKVVKVCRLLFSKRPTTSKELVLEKIKYKLSNTDTIPFKLQMENSVNVDSFLWILAQVIIAVALATDKVPTEHLDSHYLEGFQLGANMDANSAVRFSSIVENTYLKGGTSILGGAAFYKIPNGKNIINNRYTMSTRHKAQEPESDHATDDDESQHSEAEEGVEATTRLKVVRPANLRSIPSEYLEELHDNKAALRRSVPPSTSHNREDTALDMIPTVHYTPPARRALEYPGSFVWQPVSNWNSLQPHRKDIYRLFPWRLSARIRHLIKRSTNFIPESESEIARAVGMVECVLLEYGSFVPLAKDL